MKKLCTLTSTLCLSSILTVGVAPGQGPVAWWTFDSTADGVVVDCATDRDDHVEGNHTLMRGAVGNGAQGGQFTILAV